MNLSQIRERAIAPALALLPARLSSAEAEIMLLAIGLQESLLIHQRQIKGPATGLWQFERAGGVAGVLGHPQTKAMARELCKARGVEPVAAAVHEALAGCDDVLDAGFARLLLWTDPARLPGEHDVWGGFDYYLRTWRPGAYSRGGAQARQALRDKWAKNWAAAVREVVR